jgi:hypothetical protein
MLESQFDWEIRRTTIGGMIATIGKIEFIGEIATIGKMNIDTTYVETPFLQRQTVTYELLSAGESGAYLPSTSIGNCFLDE